MRFDCWTVLFQCNSGITAKLDDNTEHNYAFVFKKIAARFSEISGEEIHKPAEKAVNKNMVKTSATWMNVWKLWAESKDPKDDIVKYEDKEMDECLSRFLAEIRKSKCSLPIQHKNTVTPAYQTVVHHFHGSQLKINYGASVVFFNRAVIKHWEKLMRILFVVSLYRSSNCENRDLKISFIELFHIVRLQWFVLVSQKNCQSFFLLT